MSKKTSLKKLILFIFAELLLIAAVVFVLDPFYQYHGPLFGGKAVLNDRDNQMPGTVRNFKYDSVLLGSSVMENCDNTYLDRQFGGNSIKIARASGSVADLLYYLDMAEKNHSISQVFWCLDLPSLTSPVETTLHKNSDAPWYLHTKNVIDDVPYVYNKQILMEKIPYSIAGVYLNKNVGGNAYNWAEDKVFSAEQVMRVYQKPKKVMHEKPFEEEKLLLSQNLVLLETQMKEHPDCTYRFFIPPFSMCWWDCAYVNGELEKNFYVLEETMKMLTQVENAELYFYQDEEDIICNLDNYMDMIHYTPQINQYMLEQLSKGEGKVEVETVEKTVKRMRKLVKKIYKKKIYNYY